jgi:hypothetical protein
VPSLEDVANQIVDEKTTALEFAAVELANDTVLTKRPRRDGYMFVAADVTRWRRPPCHFVVAASGISEVNCGAESAMAMLPQTVWHESPPTKGRSNAWVLIYIEVQGHA